MANTNSAIRFDHREIAVIFSLFIFVALLMFTVGILVGKGLAQAQYSGGLSQHETTAPRDVAEVPAPNPASLGTSVSTDKHEEAASHEADKAEHGAEHGAEHAALNSEHGESPEKEGLAAAAAAATAKHEEHSPDTSSPSANMPLRKSHSVAVNEEVPQPGLKLIPKKPGVIPDDPSKREAQHVMNDPKLAELFEEAKGPLPKKPKSESREITSTDPLAGSESGRYTLQIGSYPTKKDAEDRVTALKKLGFSYSYTSAKTLEGSKDTWYRVWLGYYPDSESAKKSGEALQARGEVKNYIVKKTDQQD